MYGLGLALQVNAPVMMSIYSFRILHCYLQSDFSNSSLPSSILRLFLVGSQEGFSFFVFLFLKFNFIMTSPRRKNVAPTDLVLTFSSRVSLLFQIKCCQEGIESESGNDVSSFPVLSQFSLALKVLLMNSYFPFPLFFFSFDETIRSLGA